MLNRDKKNQHPRGKNYMKLKYIIIALVSIILVGCGVKGPLYETTASFVSTLNSTIIHY